jgi:hypothetical protein
VDSEKLGLGVKSQESGVITIDTSNKAKELRLLNKG